MIMRSGETNQHIEPVVRKESFTMNGYDWRKQDCPVCEASQRKFLGYRGGKSHRSGIGVECRIWECAICGLIFPDPMPFPKLGIDQHYCVAANEFFVNHEEAIKIRTAHLILSDAEIMLGRPGRLLDVGAGRGETLKVGLDRGWDVEGVEPSGSFADYIESNIGVRVFRSPLESCEIIDEQYDLVILSAVLEHLYNPNEVLAEISRVLKPGGLLFFDVPNEKGLYFRVGNLYQKLRRKKWCVNLSPTFAPFHVFGFGIKSIRRILERNRLSLTKVVVFGGISKLPYRSGFLGKLEGLFSNAVSRASNLIRMGSYIAGWAKKV